MNGRQFAQTTHDRIKNGPQDARTVRVKRLPKLVLAPAPGARDRRQMQEDAAIFQIRPEHKVADPAQKHGALGLNEGPIIVRKEGAAGDSPSVNELAKRVRQPAGYLTDIVVRQEPAIDGRGHQVAHARRRIRARCRCAGRSGDGAP